METKILIVEDEAIVAEDIAIRLQKMNYIITDIVASEEEAINSIMKNTPNLVLMDIMLQGDINGISTAKKIYELEKIPIIYLTAYGDEETLKRAKFAGSFGYIIKPFSERELRVNIEIALSRYEAELALNNALEIAEKLRREAEDKSQLKSQYLSIASHELKNPLTNIKAWTQLLQRYEQKWSAEKKQESLQKIEASAEQMNQLLEAILTLGITEANRHIFNPIYLDLSSFCQKLIQNHQFTAGEKYDLIFHEQANCQQAYLDATLLTHILNNLLSNAIKYSPQGGKILLTIYRESKEICVQVEDQGIGIPHADLHRLFTPFQRASNVGKIQGTGLGLVIVKRVVDLHKGKIDIESQEGKGTKVIVRLPQ